MTREMRKQLIEVRADLRAAILKSGGYAAVAREIGCTREALSNLTGPQIRKRPGLDMARALEDRLGIPMRRWAGRYRFCARNSEER